ncbi:MAG: LuxR C-terminal-related transcriptional regulator, partial [Bacteroidota bacterium]
LRLGIRAIAKQGMYFSSEIRPAVEAFFVKSNGAISSFIQSDIDLTPREAEVLQLIIQEKTTAEIAIELSISTRTVDTHRRNLILKTGVRNTAGLVRFSMENNLY